MAITRYLEVGIEKSFGAGVGVGGSEHPVRTRSVGHANDRGVIYDETIEEYFPADAAAGMNKLSGSMEMAVRADEIGELLFGLMGAGGYTKPVEGVPPYKHTFELDDPSSLELHIGETGVMWDVLGTGMKSAEFSFAKGEFITASFDYIAKSINKDTFSAPVAFSGCPPFTAWQLTLDIGGAITGVEKMTLSIDRSLKEDYFVIDSPFLQGLYVEGVGELGGTLTITEAQLDEIKRAMFGSISDGPLAVTNDLFAEDMSILATLGTGGDLKSIEFIAAEGMVIYPEASWEVSGRDYIAREVPFRILRGLSIELKNDHVEYKGGT